MDEGYPQDMRNWRGVPTHIDGAITWKDGKTKRKFNLLFVIFSGITYFFKNGHFWRFDDYMVITATEIPLKIAPHWFDCR